MARTGFRWQVTPEAAFTALYDDYAKAIYREILALMKRYEPEIQAWLVANKVWIDRTGNLKQSLHTDVEATLTEIVLSFDYGLDYGLFIATMKQGQYDVIAPALDYFAPKIWNDIQALFR